MRESRERRENHKIKATLLMTNPPTRTPNSRSQPHCSSRENTKHILPVQSNRYTAIQLFPITEKSGIYLSIKICCHISYLPIISLTYGSHTVIHL